MSTPPIRSLSGVRPIYRYCYYVSLTTGRWLAAPVDRGGDDDEHKVVGEFGVDADVADREVGSSTRRRVAVRQRRGQQRCGRRLRQPQVVCGIICHYQLLSS